MNIQDVQSNNLLNEAVDLKETGNYIMMEYYCLCTFVFYYKTMLIIQVKLSLCFETIKNRLPSPSISIRSRSMLLN